ncbi:unnamed protein product [Effrenium voratum]|uniref:Bifunctional lysine-specific demethylase and histidyl-hydroxylase n=1 Tax=Effrenium voratum TaxID=2562239 RepID=A0AA36MV70_9DINO|nr:unnamed protein product [Effrenium voratum]
MAEPGLDWAAGSPEEAFAWLVAPLTPKQFFQKHWEKRPLHLQGASGRFDGLLPRACLEDGVEARLRKGLAYGKELNLARCGADGQVMCNGKGLANLTAVKEKVAQGCSVQVVHPQRFCPKVAALLARLEAHFGCLWGANSFRTPAGGKGFKAHHDEVEVFMLQLEGAKRWRLHSCPKGPLPRDYCWDYSEQELGEPLMELVLKQGDLLYLPRGTVHKGEAVEGEESHHLTISTYQKFSWADFMQKVLPTALDQAAASEPRFREGLPLRCLSWLGEQHSAAPRRRRAFLAQLRSRLRGLARYAAPAARGAGDFLGAQLVARRLPPVARRPAEGVADVAARAVRWAEPGAVRVVVESRPGSEPEIQIYHSWDNAAENHMQDVEPEPACIVLEGLQALPTLQALNRACGEWIPAASLDSELLEGLCEHGLVETGDLGRVPRKRPREPGRAARRRSLLRAQKGCHKEEDGRCGTGAVGSKRKRTRKKAKRSAFGTKKDAVLAAHVLQGALSVCKAQCLSVSPCEEGGSSDDSSDCGSDAGSSFDSADSEPGHRPQKPQV